MTAPVPPRPLRDLLTNILAGAMCAQEETAEAAGDESWWGWGTDQIADFLADAVLSDPRIAVVRLPDAPTGSVGGSTFVESVAYWDNDSTHRVVARGPVINCLRAYWNTDAGDDPTDFAAALLAAARHINNNRGEPS